MVTRPFQAEASGLWGDHFSVRIDQEGRPRRNQNACLSLRRSRVRVPSLPPSLKNKELTLILAKPSGTQEGAILCPDWVLRAILIERFPFKLLWRTQLRLFRKPGFRSCRKEN